MDAVELMDRLGDRQVVSAFEGQCRQLESDFRYIELLPDAEDDLPATSKQPSLVAAPAVESSYQAALVQEICIRMDQLCTEALGLLEHVNKISNGNFEMI